MPRSRMKAYTKTKTKAEMKIIGSKGCDGCGIEFRKHGKQRAMRHHRYCQECYDIICQKEF